MKIKMLVALVLLCLAYVAQAQDNIIPSGHRMMEMADRYEILSGKMMQGTQMTGGFVTRNPIFSLLDSNTNLSSVDRFNLWNYLKKDLQYGDGELEFPEFGKQPFYKNFYASPAYLFDYYNEYKSYRFTINPVLELNGGRNLKNEIDRNLYINTRGVEVKGFLGKGEKIGFYSLATENQVGVPDYYNFYSDSLNFFPNQGFWKRFKETGYDFFQARGHFWFDVNEHLTLRFGHDKVHWGNGVRSLVLGDFAPPNLFLQSNVNFGIFNYQNLFTEYKDYSILTGGDLLDKKYGAFHRLGINFSKNLNIGFFEAIMFDRQDSVNSGGYDINYLNPVIFYRAVEQNLGSQDNALVGVDWKWNFLRSFQFYGQFILDEFKLDELRGKTGWWANKYGTQAGIKYLNIAGIKNLDFQLEYNNVRPFTYSHFRNGGNWSHFRQPLAHPLGANFREFLLKIQAQPLPRLFINTSIVSAIKGEDPSLNGDNYGGDILRDYATRKKERGNFTGQGVRAELFLIDAHASYMIKHNLFLDINVFIRNKNSKIERYPQTQWLNMGMRWNMDRQSRLRYF